MPKILAHQVRGTAPESKPFDLADEATGTTVPVVLRRLNPLESERASDQAETLAVRWVFGGWFDEATRKTVPTPDTYICSDGTALVVSHSALHTAARFCASQVVDDESERYEPMEWLELCQKAEGIYGSALAALAEVSVRPKAKDPSESSPPTAPSS